MGNMWPEKLKYAPILICPYLRYDLLKRVIGALQKNTLAKESAVFFFCDAPYRDEHAEGVQKVRDYLKTVDGFQHVVIVEREKNFGPLNNYIDAKEQLFKQYDRVIVLEDDIITSAYFLKFMNDALEVYKDSPEIMGISSYRAPFTAQSKHDIYFMQHLKSWGNAYWRKWHEKATEFDAAEMLVKLEEKKLMRQYNYYSSIIIPHERLLRKTAQRQINALDAVMDANILYKGGYVIFPARSLSNHEGFEDGQHTTVGIKDFMTVLSDTPIEVVPHKIEEDPKLVKSLHCWILKSHLKLLVKYLITLGPIRAFLRNRKKNREF